MSVPRLNQPALSSQIATLDQLPPPPPGRTGWPWTDAPPPLPAARADGKPWPRITVVTPSYKQGLFLEETIRSVLLQGYPNLEYIIIDGGSPDNSVDVIKKYADWVAYWVSEPDQGQSQAINKGFARSTGEIMGWLNSDDILLPHALRHTVETFIREPATMITTGFRKLYDANSRFRHNWFYWTPDSTILRHYCVVGQETTYWRRDVWEQIGPLDETLRFAMDYEYWQRMLAAGYQFKLLPHYLGGFRQHPDGKTSSWTDVRLQELAIIYQRYQIAVDEADVLERQPELMGQNFRLKHRFWKDFLHQGVSNHPRFLLLVFHIMNIPILSNILVELHYMYACYLRGRCYGK